MVTYMAMNTIEDVGKYRFFLTDAQNIFSHPLRFRIFLRGKSFSYKKDTSIRFFMIRVMESEITSPRITSICDARTFSHFFQDSGSNPTKYNEKITETL